MKYTLLGKDEGTAICDFCHKKEITILYIVKDNDTGEIQYFGSTCIHKALKIGDNEFKEMKAALELSELKKPCDFSIEKGTYLGVPSLKARIIINGKTYRRERTRTTEKEVMTDKGYWTEVSTGKCSNEPVLVRDELLKYFRNLKRLQNTLNNAA